MKEYLLFDLDGTLTDPKVGITTCVQYALKEFGIEEPDLDKLEPFIGPPLKDSFKEFYGFSDEDAQKAVEKYRERFREIGLYENDVYEGIPQMLRLLQSRGMYLAVASSKPTVFVEQILEHFDLRRYFKVVVGSELEGSRVNKDEVVLEALNRLFNYKPIAYDKVYMIGDRKFDVEGAKAIGVESVAVAYGYGSMEELKEAHADYIVRSVEELRSLLMREAEALKAARDAKQQNAAGGEQKKKSFMGNVWPFLYPLLLFIMVKALTGNVLLMILQFLGNSVSGPIAEKFFIYENGQLAAMSGNVSALFNALTYAVPAGIVFKMMASKAILKRKEEDRLKHLKADSVKSYVLFGIVSISSVAALNILFEIGGVTKKAEAYAMLAADEYSANFLVGVLCTCVIVPVAEEVVFRGAIYNAVKKLYKPQFAILMSALLYGLINTDSVQGVYGFVMGCFAAYTYEYFGSFYMALIVRVVASVVAYVMTYTSIVNTALYSGPMCILFLAVTVVAIHMITREKKIL